MAISRVWRAFGLPPHRAETFKRSRDPLHPGQPEPHTHDHIRHGPRDRFAALDVRAGTVTGEWHHRHRSRECRHFLATVDRQTPSALELRRILDNSSIYKTPLIRRWRVRHPRVHRHFTPTPASASWLNLVKGWFALLTTRQLVRSSFRCDSRLRRALRPTLR